MGCAEPQLSSLNRNLFVTCALRAPDRLFGGFLGAREGTQNVFHIGVVGHTIEGAADFVRGIATYGQRAMSDYQHPEFSLNCVAMGESLDAMRRGDLDEVRSLLSLSTRRLRAGGADFFACPDNTAHLALEAYGPDLALPGLHIADVVVNEAHRLGHDTIGLLGTTWVMDSDMYRRRCEARGIATLVPEPGDATTLHGIILDELVVGSFSAEARDEVLAIIGRLADKGCSAVALACTELSLLVPPAVSPVSLLNSTRLLAQAAVDTAVGKHPLPDWRGGHD
jgi:aspartate racemase